MATKYLGGQETAKLLGVHQRTLYQWDKKGLIDTIRTPGGKRLYNVEKFLKDKNKKEKANKQDKIIDDEIYENIDGKIDICYARVSSVSQKDDLERQKKQLTEKYPNYKLIIDIGSGLNFSRIGLKKIIKLAISGKVNKLVVAYKDRLTRFGFDLIESLIKDYSNGEVIILNKTDDLEPEEELLKDLLQIMNVYVAKMNGLRKYKKLK